MTEINERACAYGENAWQAPASLVITNSDDPLALGNFELVAGSDPSYNNWADIDRLLQTMTHLAAGLAKNTLSGEALHLAVAVKHGNPCGAAATRDSRMTLSHMLNGDRRAVFGGLVMTNFAIGLDRSQVLAFPDGDDQRQLLDGVVAPQFSPEAVKVLERKGGKCRLLSNPALENPSESSLDAAERFRYVRGGMLVQPNYTYVLDLGRLPGDRQLPGPLRRDVVLAWAVGSTSNSNTVTLVRDGMLIGNGVGQQDRVGCCELAVQRAVDAGHEDELEGAVAYSDSFFPFPDGVESLAEAGIKTIVATSGSVRDDEIRAACDEYGLALLWLPDAEGRGFFGH